MRKGELIGGKYEVLEKLGEGGAGSVYRVYDVRLDKIWAVKRVKKGKPDMEERVLGKVDGNLFPRIVDVVEEENSRYLVMDWIEGETLAQKLEKRGKFSGREAAGIGIAVCDALKALHEMQPALLYLDCKPSNIMMDKNGKLWLIDFGSAVECAETDAVPIAASPGYAAPELLSGNERSRRADVRSDVFGLGRTLYALLGGPDPARPPYGACQIGSCSPEVPAKLAKIVERCTHAKPEMRFQTIQAVKDALQDFLEEEKLSHRIRALGALGTWMLLIWTARRAWVFYELVSVPQAQTAEALKKLLWVVGTACAAVCWRRIMVERYYIGRLICEPVYSIVRTEKKAERWIVALLFGALAALAVTGKVQAHRGQVASPVILRDEQLRKLLVREDAVLKTSDSVYMEISPALFEAEEELEITVRARAYDSGQEYEYVLRYCPMLQE